MSGVASQARALAALSLGLELRQPRFHVVVVGPPGSGRTFSARSMAQRIALTRATPDDLLLLPNPSHPSEPAALNLPAGKGRAFVSDMTDLYGEVSSKGSAARPKASVSNTPKARFSVARGAKRESSKRSSRPTR